MIKTLYDNFKHWSEKGSVWLIADTHFGDPDCKRMDPDWPEPHRAVKLINKCVKKQDTIVILGDVGDPKYVGWIRAAHKVLITGNHDRRGELCPYFDEVYSGPLFVAEKILLSREPVHSLPFCLNIHGHDHDGADNYDDGGHYLNIASNVCEHTPVNLGAVIRGGALSDIDTIHRMAIDGAIERKKAQENVNPDYRIEEGSEYPDITGIPADAVLTLDFENCETAEIPASQVEFLELSGVYSNILVDTVLDTHREYLHCRKATLILKAGADLPGNECGMYDDHTVFERVNSICPDLCSIGIHYADGTRQDVAIPWPEEYDDINACLRVWLKSGKCYIYAAEDSGYPVSKYPRAFLDSFFQTKRV